MKYLDLIAATNCMNARVPVVTIFRSYVINYELKVKLMPVLIGDMSFLYDRKPQFVTIYLFEWRYPTPFMSHHVVV